MKYNKKLIEKSKKIIEDLKSENTIKDNPKLLGKISHLNENINKLDEMSKLFDILHQEYQESLKSFSFIKDFNNLITDINTYPEFLRKIFKILIFKMGGYSSSLMLYKPEEKIVEMVGYFNVELGFEFVGDKNNKTSFKMGEGIAGTAAKNLKPVIVEDVETSKKFKNIDNRNINSLVSLPLKYNNQLLGIINISHPKPRKFKKENKNFLEIISSIISLKTIISGYFDTGGIYGKK